MGLIGWLAAFILFIAIEIPTMALTTIWFAGGALAGLVLYLLGAPMDLQLGAFVVISFALLALTRPNVESLIGRQARITEQVDNQEGTGTAVLDGAEWTARSAEDNLTIAPKTLVWVKEIRGVKLIVLPVAQNQTDGITKQ